MESLCTRCARQALRPRAALRITPAGPGRQLSSSILLRAEEGNNPESRTGGKSLQRPEAAQSTGPRISRHATGASRPPRAATSGSDGAPRILRPTCPPKTPRQLGQAGQPTAPSQSLLLKRTAPFVRKLPAKDAQPGSAAGVPQRPRPSGGATPANLLRRSRPGTGARTPGARPSTAAKPGGQDKRVRRANRRRETAALEEDELSQINIEEKADAYIRDVIDPPPNPTEPIEYTPGKEIGLKTLAADWPNTPISHTGTAESIVQRIEWLAQRLPHSYQTPGQLAERYTKGYLTRFESEEEKAKVMEIAESIAAKKAEALTEAKAVDVAPKDMSFDSLADRSAEHTHLTDLYVRGKYAVAPKQKQPFLDAIARGMTNNGSYTTNDQAAFMEMIEKITKQSLSKGEAQKQKSA